jgi:hypothetical protein
MNCRSLQRWLLQAEDPVRLPAEVREHLLECPACRRLQSRLVRIEQHAGRLPVPPSTAKADFVREFLAPARGAGFQPAAGAPGRLEAYPTRPWRYVAAAAAAVLFLVGAGLALLALRPHTTPNETAPIVNRPLLDSVLERDLRLAKAATQRERVEALAELAGDLHTETQILAPAATAEDLDALAQLYAQVVRDGLVPGAWSVPQTERREVLGPIARRLAETATAADQRARQVPASAPALLAIAQAARDGDGALRKLIPEEKQ